MPLCGVRLHANRAAAQHFQPEVKKTSSLSVIMFLLVAFRRGERFDEYARRLAFPARFYLAAAVVSFRAAELQC